MIFNIEFETVTNIENKIQLSISTNTKKGQKIVSESLANLAKNSSVIISRDSAGFSYAAIHNKPAIFIYTNELIVLPDQVKLIY